MRKLYNELFAGLRDLDRRDSEVLFAAGILPLFWVVWGRNPASFGTLSEGASDRTWASVESFILAVMILLVIPLVSIRKHGVAPRDLGFQVGDWRFGVKASVVLGLIVTPVLWYGAGDPAMRAEYPLSPLAARGPAEFAIWSLVYLSYYVAWEFFFRGYMLFGLEKRVGSAIAIEIQTLVSTLAHIGKPTGELFASLPGGLFLGALAWRTRSILWPLLLHWYIGVMNDAFCVLRSP